MLCTRRLLHRTRSTSAHRTQIGFFAVTRRLRLSRVTTSSRVKHGRAARNISTWRLTASVLCRPERTTRSRSTPENLFRPEFRLALSLVTEQDLHGIWAYVDWKNSVCIQCIKVFIGSRPSDHYFRSVCWFVCLSVCLFVQSFSQPSLIRFRSN